MSKVEKKPIPGYEGFYEVGDDGEVYSIGRYVLGCAGGNHRKFINPRLLKKVRTAHGNSAFDARVSLFREGKRIKVKVHHLVADAFLGRSGQQVRHLDGDTMNCAATNLRLV